MYASIASSHALSAALDLKFALSALRRTASLSYLVPLAQISALSVTSSTKWTENVRDVDLAALIATLKTSASAYSVQKAS